MKKWLTLSLCTLFMSVSSWSQLVDVIVEEYGTSTGAYPAGYVTYRVYARLQDPTDFLSAVYGIGATPGDPDHTLALGTLPLTNESTTFWNSSFGGITGQDLNPAFCAIFPEVCYDSFITIGRATSQDPGSAINILTTPGGGFIPAFENSGSTAVEIDDGAWFGLSGDLNCFPVGNDNRVLLMQATVPVGTLMFAMNIQVFNEGTAFQNQYFCHTLEGLPGTIGGVLEEDFTCHGLVYPPIWACPGCADPLACNYDPLSENNDNCIYATDCDVEVGCMDAAACNYEPLAIYEIPFSCQVAGCTNPLACNYDTFADCDDGSCSFNLGISGTVFFDTNANGGMNSGEPGMNNVEVHILPEDITVFTNSTGYFVFPGIPDGLHSLEVIQSGSVWEVNPANLSDIETPRCNGINIALISTEYNFAASASYYFMNTNIGCVNGYNAALTINNLGSLPLNGSLTLTCDPLFTFYEIPGSYYVAPNFISPGVITWNVNEQTPLNSLVYAIHVNGPGTNYVGQEFEFNFILTLYDDLGNIFYFNTWAASPMVTCAYDPNDKQTVNPGYTEDHHFVSSDEDLEYIVRFQNTGNAPAEQVIIRDTLDLDYLDIETFQPLSSSHSMMTTVESDGALTFTFDNIMLPDSTTDEPGSQGYVVYRARPRADVEHMDVIENTAYIFFDDNPPVVTNTTWHTIMDCTSLTGIVGDETFCEGDAGYFSAEQPYVENYNWTVEGEPSGMESSLMHPMDEQGVFDLGVEIINPLCTLSDALSITVHPLPETTIAENGAELTAPDGSAWQWYFEGSEIEGATDQNYTATIDGYYQVFVTNEFGCTVFSEEVLFVGLDEQASEELILFPNPMSERASLVLPLNCEKCTVELVAVNGEVIKSWKGGQNKTILIERNQLAAGVYQMRVKNTDKTYMSTKLVVR